MDANQKKAIEGMNFQNYMGYSGQIGNFTAAESDAHKRNNFWGQILDGAVMVTALALAFTQLAPVGLAIGALYAGAKAAHGLATGKDIFTGDKLSNDDKAWLVLDVAASIVSIGAGSKALSSTSKYAKFGNALKMTDNVLDAAQMTMLAGGATYAAATGNWKDPSFIMAMGLAGLVTGKGAASKFGKGARKADMPDTSKIGDNINDTVIPKHDKISSTDIDVKNQIDEAIPKSKIENISNGIDKTNIKQPAQKEMPTENIEVKKPKADEIKPLNDSLLNNQNEYDDVLNDKFSERFAEHVLKAELHTDTKGNTRIAGGHSEACGLNSEIKVKLRLPEEPADDQVYRALLSTEKLDANGKILKNKPTTMFPKNWEPQKVNDVIKQAFEQKRNSKSGIAEKQFDQDIIVNGKTYKIQIVLTDLKTYTVKSAYPIVSDPSWDDFKPLIK
jgi:hypothetical protein